MITTLINHLQFLTATVRTYIVGLMMLAAPVAAVAEGNKPPATGSLFSFEGTFDLGSIKADTGAAVSMDRLKDAGSLAIKVDFPISEAYPGIEFPVPAGGWDLSGYGGIQADITNPSTSDVSVYMRADNAGDWKLSPWSVEVLRLKPNETKPLKVTFGKAFGSDGFALDPSHITVIRFFSGQITVPFAVQLTGLRAFKAEATAAAPVVSIPEGASKPYLTTSTSPANHEKPFGQNLKLIKDWTFGKNRPDATIHNRTEMDQEFFYRYIYEGGKLDTLPTYWTVHRDYPEGDSKSLHVFGDNTLTLKARIPEGGGLRKGGIESGMLRGKLPVTPGMYIEMRAKLTRGIGAWPAFWLNPGVEYPDGTFSATPWPPEIDIFEFFNWQGREKTRELFVNVQSNNEPKKYGNPYVIFSALNANNEYVPGMDFSEDFHVFALDWRENRPIWLLDGHPIRQMYYEWNAPPAHILVTNQLGIEFAKPAMSEMKADESNWDYVIDYIRVWQREEP